VATVAFYRAVHLVEAVFAKGGNHGHTHEGRERILKQDKALNRLWHNYRQLYSASIVARYLGRGNVTAFSQYMSSDQVQSILLDHHLRQIEKTVKKLLARKRAKRKKK